MKSSRPDGRGHWPAGKRRHADAGQWTRTRLALTRFLDAEFAFDEISRRALARDMSVSPRTVGRWLRGENRPDEDVQEAMAQWLAEWRVELANRRKQEQGSH